MGRVRCLSQTVSSLDLRQPKRFHPAADKNVLPSSAASPQTEPREIVLFFPFAPCVVGIPYYRRDILRIRCGRTNSQAYIFLITHD